MQSIAEILLFAIDILWFIIMVHVILSWLISFQVLNPYQPLVRAIWNGFGQFLEPIYRPIRNVLPQTGGLDLAPLAVIFGLFALRTVISNNIGF